MHKPLSVRQLQGWVTRMPFNMKLGIRVTRVHNDGVTIELPMQEDLKNTGGVLHGGVTATMADAAVGLAIARHFGGTKHCTTVELKVNYFLPVTGKLVARARLLRVGKTLCVGSVDMFDSARKLAGAAIVTYMILGPRT